MRLHSKYRTIACVMLFVLVSLSGLATRAAEPAKSDRIDFTEETLGNGLRVIYAPLHQAPVVHVRVLYHVGSRDERADRQGFAHMFEHMMFRGSEHVKPEEHMKLIQMVGGYSNAFTSFDQTVYVNTIPANQLELALWLEADRMASFKVSDQIFTVERNVVNEEARRRLNTPYGTFYDDFFALAFKVHPYHWTPIGNMEQLRAAKAAELQQFFNTYYIPNNAVLVIAGDIDVAAAKAMVRKYFGWIPKGPDVKRNIPAEPAQTAMRKEIEDRPVPLVRMTIGYHTPPYRSDDHYALGLLGDILGSGDSSRLGRLLVNSTQPLCVNVGASDMALEDGGFFGISAMVMQGKDPGEVEKEIFAAVRQVIERGVTSEELAKAKTIQRVALVGERETAERIASQLGSEELFGGDANRVNTQLAKIDAVSLEDIQAVARKYLQESNAAVLRVKPGMPAAEPATTRPATVASATDQAPTTPREIRFPEGYPTKPPIADSHLKANFAKGTASTINGVTVVVMPDHRLPQINWSVTMRAGSHSDPVGKEGLASLTADLLSRGAAGLNFEQLSRDLESRGITIAVSDAGDYTRLSGSCLTEQLDHAMQRSRDILLSPALPAEEFAKLKEQTLNALRVAEASPDMAAKWQLQEALFGKSPVGRHPTSESVRSISLEDVKDCYKRLYRPTDAILVIAGDVTVERGQALAKKLLEGWETAPLPKPDYGTTAAQDKLRIIVVDRPEGKQAMIRMATPIYDVQNDEKYAGSLASSILSAGIDSRLGRYVRAEKGLVYSVYGRFQPSRHGSIFMGGAETKLTTAAECVEAMFKVFNDMGRDGVSQTELSEAKLRAVGSMVMAIQTIQQQADYRVEGILNGYPVDYWDRYPERVSAVPATQVGQVVATYLKPAKLTVVVVAPAAAVKDQLEKLGTVEVVPMPK